MRSTLPLLLMLLAATAALAEPPVAPAHSRAELEALWRGRVQSFLDRGVTPIIDMESSLRREDAERHTASALKAMDKSGVALMALDGYQAKKDGTKGYRWGYGVHEAANAHPDRFVLATNGGTNDNWLNQKGGSDRGFIDQTEVQVRSGDYPIMGEFEFRHYMSSSQCQEGRTDRDETVPLTSASGHRLFALSQETGVAFLIHLEPEDAQLDDLETMLAAYPGARVIACHFGQVRHPERQRAFTPERVRAMLTRHPNLYYDISVGHPGRRYPCSGVLDTVLWQGKGDGGQCDRLKPEYRAILTDFHDRFVAGFDYGGGRPPWGEFIKARAANVRLIVRDLPKDVQRDICYRNAWKLLTGKAWE
ncbi:amidohydrolase family protein [Pseudodesulfovibrio sp.]|uniref:amidohydrolase family protein n=1 Tax=Pseudodesulfovibrio sp. TaxID=2035812 RepID=UPI00262A518C|nr:amidohydrolase family protein [Pseudodesulfovibrio sp.]MDD3313022.1 amidohydrolase family protein [Pseudodesulfovibrio sp.]